MVKSVGWILIAILAASLPGSTAAPAITELQSPSAAGSEAPNLSVAPDGRVLLSWLEPTAPKGNALRFSLHDKQGWSAPRTITSGTDWFVSGADYPTVTFLPDGVMAANSLIATDLHLEAYNTNIFLS